MPIHDTFFLLAYESLECQQVRWALATREWIYYDTFPGSGDSWNGARPFGAGTRDGHTIYYCRYRGEIRCGEIPCFSLSVHLIVETVSSLAQSIIQSTDRCRQLASQLPLVPEVSRSRRAGAEVTSGRHFGPSSPRARNLLNPGYQSVYQWTIHFVGQSDNQSIVSSNEVINQSTDQSSTPQSNQCHWIDEGIREYETTNTGEAWLCSGVHSLVNLARRLVLQDGINSPFVWTHCYHLNLLYSDHRKTEPKVTDLSIPRTPLTGWFFLVTGCNNTLSGTNGTFQSPNYPRPYPNGQLCSWRVNATRGHRVLLRFTNFFLQAERDTDSVRIFDGHNESFPVLGEFYGGRIPPHDGLTSSSDVMFVIFTSDAVDAYAGFQASYETIPALPGLWHVSSFAHIICEMIRNRTINQYLFTVVTPDKTIANTVNNLVTSLICNDRNPKGAELVFMGPVWKTSWHNDVLIWLRITKLL